VVKTPIPIAAPTAEPIAEPMAEPTQPPAPTPEATVGEPIEVPAAEVVSTPVSEETPPTPTAAPRAAATRAPPAARPTEPRTRGATVDIASDPPDADVLIDGIVQGKTPLRVPALAAGNVLLEIRKIGYAPYYKAYASSADRNTRYTRSSPRIRDREDG